MKNQSFSKCCLNLAFLSICLAPSAYSQIIYTSCNRVLDGNNAAFVSNTNTGSFSQAVSNSNSAGLIEVSQMSSVDGASIAGTFSTHARSLTTEGGQNMLTASFSVPVDTPFHITGNYTVVFSQIGVTGGLISDSVYVNLANIDFRTVGAYGIYTNAFDVQGVFAAGVDYQLDFEVHIDLTALYQGPGQALDYNATLNLALTLTNQPPSLSISQIGSTFAVQWPFSATNVLLETATNLSAPIVWIAVTNQPQIVGAMFSVPIDPAKPTQFFRLKQN